MHSGAGGEGQVTKSEKYRRSIEKDRNAWRAEMKQICMRCCRRYWLLDVHEIECKSHAPNRWWHRCSALLLCRPCHREMNEAGGWPHSRQLWLKRTMDPKHFDLAAWHAIKPRPTGYVTMEEIEAW
jgi:hypothetical protein